VNFSPVLKLYLFPTCTDTCIYLSWSFLLSSNPTPLTSYLPSLIHTTPSLSCLSYAVGSGAQGLEGSASLCCGGPITSEARGLRLSALVKLKSHPLKGIYSCLFIEIFQFSSIEIFQFSSSFPAPVIPYISYSTPTTTCGSHASYSTSIYMKAPTPSPSLFVLSPNYPAYSLLPCSVSQHRQLLLPYSPPPPLPQRMTALQEDLKGTTAGGSSVAARQGISSFRFSPPSLPSSSPAVWPWRLSLATTSCTYT
jgi:hypothetical protein